MADAPSLQTIYNSRFIEHSLSSAVNYLTGAAMDAARAHDGLHWLKHARESVGYAKECIETFERFDAAIKAGNTIEAAALAAEHAAHVRKTCGDIDGVESAEQLPF